MTLPVGWSSDGVRNGEIHSKVGQDCTTRLSLWILHFVVIKTFVLNSYLNYTLKTIFKENVKRIHSFISLKPRH
jgi:hypothetical protein